VKLIQLNRNKDHLWLYFFTPWNLLDVIRILTMVVYLISVCEESESDIQNSYSFLTLVSWISVLNYLRIFPQIRIFIELISNTVKSLTSFLATYLVLVVSAFVLAFY
jgi:hypothetical protein